MIEIQIQSRANELERLLRVPLVGQQRQPVLDLCDLRRAPISLDPLGEQLLGLVELLGVEIMQAVKIVVLPRPGNQRLQHLFAVLGKREFLDETHLLSGD